MKFLMKPDLARQKISTFSHQKEAAAARSTGLRPIHFSNRGNGRGSQLQVTIITEL
jgi:hypothetical protein